MAPGTSQRALSLLLAATLALSGCAASPYTFGVDLEGPRTLKLREGEPQIERGRPNVVIDSIGSWIFGLPSKILLLNHRVDNHDVSEDTAEALHEYDEDAWKKTLDVNLTGVLRVTQAAVPLMLGAPSAVVNTSSRAGKTPARLNGAYSVSKAGVIMLTKAMALELAPHQIRVNAVCPGLIRTDLQKGNVALKAHFWQVDLEEAERRMLEDVPLGRMGTIEEVAELCVMLASPQASYVTGQAINIGGGMLMEL